MQSEHDLLCFNNPAPNIGKIMPHSSQIISGQRAMQLENTVSLSAADSRLETQTNPPWAFFMPRSYGSLEMLLH